jgi:hypothetical protein
MQRSIDVVRGVAGVCLIVLWFLLQDTAMGGGEVLLQHTAMQILLWFLLNVTLERTFVSLPHCFFIFHVFLFLSLFLSLCFCCMCVLFNGAGCAQFGAGVAGIIFLS